MTLKSLKHVGVMQSVIAYLIFKESVKLIMNNLLGSTIEILVQCNNFESKLLNKIRVR